MLFFLEIKTVAGQMNLDEMANIFYLLLLFFTNNKYELFQTETSSSRLVFINLSAMK